MLIPTKGNCTKMLSGHLATLAEISLPRQTVEIYTWGTLLGCHYRQTARRRVVWGRIGSICSRYRNFCQCCQMATEHFSAISLCWDQHIDTYFFGWLAATRRLLCNGAVIIYHILHRGPQISRSSGNGQILTILSSTYFNEVSIIFRNKN